MSKNETDLRGIVAIQCQNGRHLWATFLLPSLGHYLFSLVAVASTMAEIPLQLWFLAVGVNAQRWREQASGGVVQA
jgi:hypothetical protein